MFDAGSAARSCEWKKVMAKTSRLTALNFMGQDPLTGANFSITPTVRTRPLPLKGIVGSFCGNGQRTKQGYVAATARSHPVWAMTNLLFPKAYSRNVVAAEMKNSFALRLCSASSNSYSG